MGFVAGEDEAERNASPAPEQTTDRAAETPTAEAPPAEASIQAEATSSEPIAPSAPGFGERGRMRRRARFLRKARELAYRDLGGLVYDLHRFGQRNDQVVLAKLSTLGHIDTELRALERALREFKPVTVLHEVGVAACPRCAALHGNEDRFCPGCGLAFAAGAERPLSTAPVTTAVPAANAAAPTQAATSPGERQPSPNVAAPSAQTPSPAAPVTPARPAGEPLTTIERPPAPALKPTAAPVAARPSTQKPDGDSHGDANGEPEQEATQILRPPTGSV